MPEDTKQNSGGDNKKDDEKKSGSTEENESEEKVEGSSDEGVGKIASPEGVIMFIIAAFFDALGLLGFIPLIGWIIELISDIVAGVVFGIWMVATGRKGWWKIALAFLLEAIPYVDDAAPFISLTGMIFGAKIPSSWIGFVYSVL